MTSAPSFRLLPVEATWARQVCAALEDAAMRAIRDIPASLLSAAPVMAEATGWQPIETAPKDGTHILVWWSTTPPAAFETYWDGDESQGDRPGWYGPGWGHILDGRIELGWMPLPSLPDPPALNAALAIAAGQLGEKESGNG